MARFRFRSKRVGELDCLVCALQAVHGVGFASNPNLTPGTMRDAHVWLFWADMPCAHPGRLEVL